MKKTLVIGASTNPDRYSYKAINMLLDHGHEVVAIGNGSGEVGGVSFDKNLHKFEAIDTITLYINPKIQEVYYDYIINLKPKRIIFNPGTENESLYNLAKANGIEPVIACTLVMLATGQY